MDDKELLELAAKAAGLWDFKNSCIDAAWSPLTNDGDAFRLAVDLELLVGTMDFSAIASQDTHAVYEQVPFGDIGKYAATRRAIFLAAAKIGKAL